MRVAYTEDALQVLTTRFGYEIFNFAERGGIILTKRVASRRRLIAINLPYGDPTIPEEALQFAFQFADFSMDEFWAAHDEYVAD